MRTLLAVLAVSTGRRVFAQPKLIRYRRMVGLFAFAYLCLHLLAYLLRGSLHEQFCIHFAGTFDGGDGNAVGGVGEGFRSRPAA